MLIRVVVVALLASLPSLDYPMPPEKVPTAPTADQRTALRASLLRRSTSEGSSTDSAHMEHTWTTGTRRRGAAKPDHSCSSSNSSRGNKRKHESLRAPTAMTREASETDSEYDVGEGEESFEEPDDDDRRVSRRAYMDIPSFSFLKGSYRLYPTAVSEALHSMEEAGSALLTDASTAISSAKKSLRQSSKELYNAVRSTIETVVQDIVKPEESGTSKTAAVDTEDEQQEVMAPNTPQTGRRRASEGVRRKSTTTASKRRSSVTATALPAEPASPEVSAPSTRSSQRMTRSAMKAQRARSASRSRGAV